MTFHGDERVKFWAKTYVAILRANPSVTIEKTAEYSDKALKHFDERFSPKPGTMITMQTGHEFITGLPPKP
jgi:hypothetical protein